MPGKGAPTPPKPDARQSFPAGGLLFNEGEPGGDLFFIEDGVVEIFQTRGDDQLVLAEMKAGEVIGVMTCMTAEKRMASARAKTPVIIKKVPRDIITKVIAGLPNWMKIVLKEFTLRLAQMNRQYTDACLKIKKLQLTQVSNSFQAAQIASAFAAIGELTAVSTDYGKIVIISDTLQKLESVLNMKIDDIQKLWQNMMESGLLKVEIESEKKREITMLDNARKLTFFAQFVNNARVGANKKLLRARFSNKETRVLSGLTKFAQRQNLDLNKVCRLQRVDVEKSMERSTGIAFDREALQKGLDLKLLTIEGDEERETLVFRPAEMGRTVACIEAMRRLAALEGDSGSDA